MFLEVGGGFSLGLGQDNICYIFCSVDNMFRTEDFQFGEWAEAPRHTAGGDMGIEGRLHVDTRIAYVEGIVGSDGGLLQDVEDDGGVGLGSYSFTLAIDGGEADGGKVVGNELFGSRLVFVGGHGQLDLARLEAGQQFGNAWVRTAFVRIVLVVVGNEMATDFQDVFFRLFSFGQGTFEELVDAVAYHELVGGFLVGGVAQGLKGVVGALRQVGDGVQQGAVEVEYNQFFHLVSSFSFVFFCAKVVFISIGRSGACGKSTVLRGRKRPFPVRKT